MTQQQGAIVLRDGQGNLYTIPEAALQNFRVPDDRKAEVAETHQEPEVQAYSWNAWSAWNTDWNSNWTWWKP
jgi:hypothetical protein